MEQKRDYYEILGINRNADASQIKKAYRKLAKKYHPDTNSGDVGSEQRFKEVSEAYSILNDPEKRKLYDKFGHAAFEEGFSPNQSWENARQGNTGKGSYDSFHFESGNMDDLFNDIFGNIFGSRGQGHGRRAAGAEDRTAAGKTVTNRITQPKEETLRQRYWSALKKPPLAVIR